MLSLVAYSRGQVRIGTIALLAALCFAFLPASPAAAEAQALTTPGGPPVLTYALTASSNPVAPGGAAVFTWTVTNRTTVTQDYQLCYIVPEFTQSGASPAGAKICQGAFGLSAGASTSFIINLTVLSGASTPPDGSLINLTVTDPLDAVSVSRSVIVQSVPEAGLALSIPDGTFVPKESFTTTLTYHNYSAGTLSGLQLSLPVPAGASFVSADGGGVLGGDGVVRWSPGPLAASATGVVHLTLQVGVIAPATAGLLVVDAALNDSSSALLADASDALPVYATPVLTYALSATSNPVGPAAAAEFTWTVTNPTTVTQDYQLCYIVPEFTQSGASAAGTKLCQGTFGLSAGTSTSFIINLKVLSGASTPADGSLINLTVRSA